MIRPSYSPEQTNLRGVHFNGHSIRIGPKAAQQFIQFINNVECRMIAANDQGALFEETHGVNKRREPVPLSELSPEATEFINALLPNAQRAREIIQSEIRSGVTNVLSA